MQEHDNQILVPPSFMAVYTDTRGRLRESADVVRARYELCEDLAGHLVEQAQIPVPRAGAVRKRNPAAHARRVVHARVGHGTRRSDMDRQPSGRVVAVAVP